MPLHHWAPGALHNGSVTRRLSQTNCQTIFVGVCLTQVLHLAVDAVTNGMSGDEGTTLARCVMLYEEEDEEVEVEIDEGFCLLERYLYSHFCGEHCTQLFKMNGRLGNQGMQK